MLIHLRTLLNDHSFTHQSVLALKQDFVHLGLLTDSKYKYKWECQCPKSLPRQKTKLVSQERCMLIPGERQSVSVECSFSCGHLRLRLIPDANIARASLLSYVSGRIRLPLSPCLFLVFMWKQTLPARAWPEGGSVISCGRQAGNNWWGVVEEKQAVNTLPYDNSKGRLLRGC